MASESNDLLSGVSVTQLMDQRYDVWSKASRYNSAGLGEGVPYGRYFLENDEGIEDYEGFIRSCQAFAQAVEDIGAYRGIIAEIVGRYREMMDAEQLARSCRSKVDRARTVPFHELMASLEKGEYGQLWKAMEAFCGE